MRLNEEDIISKMVEIREELNQLLQIKYELIENINKEIEILRVRINEIDKFIGANSFTTADKMLDTETFLKEKKMEKIKDIDVVRKIFYPKDLKTVLIILRYNGENLEIAFPHPNLIKLKAESEIYLNSIITPLIELKESETNMEILVVKKNNEGYISRLQIKNIFQYEDAEIIFNIFKKMIYQYFN